MPGEMGTSEASLILENIQEFINDENKIVTCKWLSLTLSIHINVAKQALCNFVNEERNKGGDDDINVTYFVAGLGESKLGQQVLKCVVVPETELEAVKSSLNPITSCHIYSVQKAKLKDYTALYQTDYEAIKENQSTLNKYSSIKCPWATLRQEKASIHHKGTDETSTISSGVKLANDGKDASSNVPSSKNSNEKGTQKTSNIASMFAAAGKKEKKEKPSSESKKEESKKDESQKSKPKESKTGVMSFFKSQPEKTDVKPREKTNVKPKEKEPAVETKDKSKNSNSSRQKKPRETPDAAGPQKKRRRIRTDLFDSSDEEDNVGVVSEEEHFSEPEEPKVNFEEQNSPSLFNDNAKDSDEDMKTESPKKDTKTNKGRDSKDKIQGVGKMGERKRKRIRRLVPKQHIDEDGFMVTEKVWESDSTDASDEEVKQPQKTSPKSPPKNNPPASAKGAKGSAGTKKKAAKPSPSKNKQTSLTSFFKKS